jgi:1A family penicillin-binding protein
MAIKRTGFANWGGLAKSSKKFLVFLGLCLELLGRPVLWVLWALFLILLNFFRLSARLLKTGLKLIIASAVSVIKLLGATIFLVLKLFISLISLFLSFFKIIPFSQLEKKTKAFFKKAKLFLLKPRRLRLPRLEIPKLKPGWKFFSFLSLILILGAGGTWAYLVVLKDLPHPDRLISRRQAVSTKIYDRNGKLLYKIYRNQNRTLVKIEDIPAHLVQATVAIEDAEFYQHYGFSPKGILRSLGKNIAQGKLQGGSTITQQLVKNALLTPERTLVRKLKELVLSIQAEMRFDKEEILQMYLNEVGYGGAAYGAEEASWKYFGKSVRQLNLAESALLAGLPASPTLYSPLGAHPELAKKRQIQVLQRMAAEGFITPEEAEKAKAEELNFSPQETNIKAPHFVMYVKDLLVRQFGEQLVEEGGLEVVTSLDLELQNLAQKVVTEEVENLKKLQVSNGAALITRPPTGEILAMVGSRDYFDLEHDGNVNITLCPRQPGSAIKPVNYAVALGNGFTPATILSDTPITYKIPGQPPYSPQNYDNRFHGEIPLRTALGSSYNVPAVKVLSSYGVEKMIEMGKELGITTWEDSQRFGLSLTLGGGEVKMIDVALAYGSLANSGQKVPLNPILKVTDYRGKLYQGCQYPSEKNGLPDSSAIEADQENFYQPETVLDPKIAFLLNDILSDNSARTPAFGAYSLLNIPDQTIAVKTGTTNNLRDNWTIGYTPKILVAAWVGNNDNSPMNQIASGLTGASSIWNQIMTNVLINQENQPFPRPEGIVEIEICPLTGTLPCQGCPVKKEFFIAGTEPKTHCRVIPPEPENEEREKISSAKNDQSQSKPTIIDYQPPKRGEIIWERIRR